MGVINLIACIYVAVCGVLSTIVYCVGNKAEEPPKKDVKYDGAKDATKV